MSTYLWVAGIALAAGIVLALRFNSRRVAKLKAELNARRAKQEVQDEVANYDDAERRDAGNKWVR